MCRDILGRRRNFRGGNGHIWGLEPRFDRDDKTCRFQGGGTPPSQGSTGDKVSTPPCQGILVQAASLKVGGQSVGLARIMNEAGNVAQKRTVVERVDIRVLRPE